MEDHNGWPSKEEWYIAIGENGSSPDFLGFSYLISELFLPLVRYLVHLMRHALRLLLLRGLFAHGAAEEFGQRGIEGGACLLFDLLECLIDGEGCSFRLFGGQVVKHLGDSGNASKQGGAVFS